MKICPKGWSDCSRCHRERFKSNAHGPDMAIKPLLPGRHGEAIEDRDEWHRKRAEILDHPEDRPDLVAVLQPGQQAKAQAERFDGEAEALKVCATAEALEELRTVEVFLRSWLKHPGLMGSDKEIELGLLLGSVELVNRQAERSGASARRRSTCWRHSGEVRNDGRSAKESGARGLAARVGCSREKLATSLAPSHSRDCPTWALR